MMCRNARIRATVAKQTMQHVCGVFKNCVTVVKNKPFMNNKMSKIQNCRQTKYFVLLIFETVVKNISGQKYTNVVKITFIKNVELLTKMTNAKFATISNFYCN